MKTFHGLKINLPHLQSASGFHSSLKKTIELKGSRWAKGDKKYVLDGSFKKGIEKGRFNEEGKRGERTRASTFFPSSLLSSSLSVQMIQSR